MPKKSIDPRALASITTTTTLIEFAKVHEAIEHIVGYDVFTHEILVVIKDVQAAVLRQFPDMPTDDGGDWQKCAAAVLERYGPTVEVERGMMVRGLPPEASLRMITDAPIIPIEV